MAVSGNLERRLFTNMADPDAGRELCSILNGATVQTFAAGISFTGATTINTVSVPDNLPDAMSIKEGSTAYLTIITTDGAEAIWLRKSLTVASGASTAAAGSATGDAGVLPAATASVYPTTAADDTKGVRVHANDKVSGRTLFIGNGVSNKILKVYPPSGGTINGASADAAFSSASGKGVLIHCLDSTANTWLAW